MIFQIVILSPLIALEIYLAIDLIKKHLAFEEEKRLHRRFGGIAPKK